ncbi:FtsW/RodA/SpoVE family cell cycle protein [Holzapfeliella floricola]|uniref:FtsW/RodA/SpoVE family cell cycle protein n=1 Tax=Holzapfeliella floricola TaxID=679249 RepID=UPI000704A3D4|nr:putative peptidoglycan glycosyltransferase FtsW [Holzapfeliella floricola]
MKKKLNNLDYSILIPFLILLGIGMVMIYSSSSYILLVNNLSPFAYLTKQLMWVVVSLVLGFISFRVKLSTLKNPKIIILSLGISWILMLFLAGIKFLAPKSIVRLFEVNGAVGWIPLGPFTIQPVEIAKFALILYLAYIFNKRTNRLTKKVIRNELFGPIVIATSFFVLALVQPDMGGAAILAVISLSLFTVSGISAKRMFSINVGLILFLIMSVALLVKWNPDFLQGSYAYMRILAFLHPFQLKATQGAQLVNSYYAIYNGGFFGVGLGNSIQKRGALPEPYTDFIMSVITEELGLIGALVVLGLLFYLIWRLMHTGLHASDKFNSLICYGFATTILIQTIFNIGAVVGLLPITGVTLPFISYGGSSLAILTVGIGLCLNISSYEKSLKEKKR